MSKRPKTAGSLLSRLRRPAGRLRDLPIWSKLGLILIVPTVATVVVGTSGIVDHLQTLNNANRSGDLASLVAYSGDLVGELQAERTEAIRLLGEDRPAEREERRKAYDAASARVDKAKEPYAERRGEVTGLPNTLENQLRFIDQTLTDLPGTRSQVFNGRLSTTQAQQQYDSLLADLINLRDSATQLAGDSELSDLMRAATALTRNKEYLSQQRDVVHVALNRELTSELRNTYISTWTGQQQWLETFAAVADRADQELFDQTVAGPDAREADSYNSNLRGLSDARNLGSAGFTPDQWDNAMAAYAALVREVEAKLDRDAVGLADELRSAVRMQVFLETGLLLSMLLLAVLFAYLVARSMARSLRDLRQGALMIAGHGLPQAVARLRETQATGGQQTPVQLANQIAEPLPVRSKDEFGQVTEAFNAVHLEAVRTAAEQAALRASVATMFVNLARRSQILVDRLIGQLDRLERGEEDPDRLAELFQLDHLATRMRRNDENLLVLAAADSTRVQREPAALIDVLRAAQSEVEHYTRIEFGVIDRDIEVAAAAVNDLVHLIAELFDNATAFSPPESQVVVEARRAGDRASLYVEDRGIGISPEQLRELNEKLATPPQVDVAVSRMMGLVVVARLASRHGVKVELRAGTDRGAVAEVSLPAGVLVPRALGAGQQLPPGLPPAPNPIAGRASLDALPASGGSISGPRPGESGNQVTLGGRPFDPAHSNGAGTPSGSPQAMPAWSDLTGATSAVTGGESHDPYPMHGQPNGMLPQRRSSSEADSTGQQPGIPRQLPRSPEAQPYGTPSTPYSGWPASGQPAAGMPTSASPVSATPASGQPSSGQPYGAPTSAAPSSGQPYGAPTSAAPSSGLPYRAPTSAAPSSGQPYAAPLPQSPAATAPSSAAPPAWPPVPSAASSVSEQVPTAPDLTTELPRIAGSAGSPPAAYPAAPASGGGPAAPVPGSPPVAPAAPQPAVPPAAAPQPAAPQRQQPSAAPQSQQPPADATMELPIFRELESAWFRTRRPGSEETAKNADPVGAGGATGQGGAATQQFARIAADRPQQAPPATTGNTPMAESPTNGGTSRQNGPTANGNIFPTGGFTSPPGRAGEGWSTAADDGWRAATAASDVPVAATTSTGLPKRTPMAQLVPGAVEKPSAAVQRRTPESVRGLLSAYHRGVQRGRNNPSDSNPTSPEGNPGGQSSQSGSGPMAGSGQKEQEG
ncbi:nitrate- and nitrite sensing domain-containing protein [Salinispora sp. H7-4]|uniref:sensor histidine kinase n=1 Tax=Salinispora sp. H7-4 TaxID=2748321 RepID=UPI0015D39121|nr:nitrate- and nitrite sensing domain-containing protein [Salinispora sp. H7-4]NYT96626.1 nitrate- and nitrite sensing domain-containing protein [Salinispora sp. H7-4]